MAFLAASLLSSQAGSLSGFIAFAQYVESFASIAHALRADGLIGGIAALITAVTVSSHSTRVAFCGASRFTATRVARGCHSLSFGREIL